MTADRVKYICNHRVTGRVMLHEVLNPEAWESRDAHLKVRSTIIDDTGRLCGEKGENEDDDEDDDNDDDVLKDVDESIAKKLVSAGEFFFPPSLPPFVPPQKYAPLGELRGSASFVSGGGGSRQSKKR